MKKTHKDVLEERYEEVIRGFKSSHRGILNSIEGVEKRLQKRSLTRELYFKIKEDVLVFQDMLLIHFEKQGFTFFQKLEYFFQNDLHQLKMIEFLSKDLNNIKIQIFTFIDLHPCNMGDVSFLNFQKDFNQLSQNVCMRIKVEEERLFLLIEKLSV